MKPLALGQNMTDNEILILVAAILLAGTAIAYFGIKRSFKRAKEERERREIALRTLLAEREASWRRMRESAVANSAITPKPVQSRVVNTVVPGNNTNTTVYSTRTDDEDIVTSIVLNSVLNSNSGTVSASVDYDNNTVSVREESAPRSSWDSIREDTSSKTSSSYSSSSSWSSSSSSDIGSSSSWD
jgi:hypothetical protein